MPALSALAGPHMQCPAVRIEVGDSKSAQFSVSRARRQSRLRKEAEIAIGGIKEPLGFRYRKISYPRSVNFVEWLDTSPSLIRLNSPFSPCAIQRRLERC